MKLAAPRFCIAQTFALLGALALVLLHAWASPSVLAALEYRADLVRTQPWRVFSAHFVHLNWVHVLVNAAAWVVVVRLYDKELTARRQLWAVVLAALAIGCALPLLWADIYHYRGFSGVLHTLYFVGALTGWRTARRTGASLRLPSLLLMAGIVKVLLETPWTATTPWADWLGAHVVPQAHAMGSLVGVLVGWMAGRTCHQERGNEAEIDEVPLHPKSGS